MSVSCLLAFYTVLTLRHAVEDGQRVDSRVLHADITIMRSFYVFFLFRLDLSIRNGFVLTSVQAGRETLQ